MRFHQIASVFVTVAMSAGCSESVIEGRKQPLAMDKVPPEIMKIAQEKYPELTFETAFTEVEDGKPVYELKGKTKEGKIREVEITRDGKIMK